jgi:monoamine oxidase
MKRFSRRAFLVASAVMGAGPAFGAPRRRKPAPAPPPAPKPEPMPGARGEVPRSGNVDVVVVGAGAAGIAATRRLLAVRGLRVVLVEAAAEPGGRCVTDTATFGVPYDRGARWIHAADINPLARLGAQIAGLDVYPAPPGQRMRIGRRFAREGEMEDYLASLVRTNSAIADAARGKADVSCDKALPKDLAEWRATVEFVLGPYTCGKDLAEVSAVDFARLVDRDNNAFCRQGLGALLGKLAAPLPLLPATPVTRIGWGNKNSVEVETAKGQFKAGAVIVTPSTNVLSSGKVRFAPELPRRVLDALSRLKLGSLDRIALELPDNPLGLKTDELVFEKSESKQTAALFGNVGGSSLCTIDVAGSFGRDLSAKGEAAMIDFALSWLTGLYGTDMKNAVKRSHATRWNNSPWTLGAISAAAPGSQPARKALMEPFNRVFLAGEAAHETMWGTVGGAWESGERAAAAVLKVFGRR